MGGQMGGQDGMSQMMAQMGQMGGQGAGVEMPEQGPPAVDMSSWAGIPDPADANSFSAGSDEQAKAIQEAVAATQHAQYMQQVQFLQQVNAHNMKEHQELDGAGLVQS